MKNLISIILPTYNRLYSLKEIFLPSLENQDYLEYELIIIDDGSSDNTDSYFNGNNFQSDFPIISKKYIYLKNKENIGAPGSRNIGVQQAKGDWIWIVEDDIEFLDKKFLSKFIEIKNTCSTKIKVISPFLEIKKNQGYYNLPGDEVCFHGKLSGEVYYDTTKKVNSFVPSIHCASFIHRETYLEVGGQDGKTFFGNTFRDETDLFVRIRKNGGKIFFAGAILYAIHRNDFAIDGGQKKINKKSLFIQEYILIKNHFLYLRKNYNFSCLRIIIFLFVRFLKHMTTITRLQFFKNILVKFKI